MEKKITKDKEDEEMLIDIDTGEEIFLEEEEVANSALKDKLKKLRSELTEAKKDRDANLAGWQRAKADLVNLRKKGESEKEIKAIRAKVEIIRSILPALDTFETAIKDESWEKIDKNWRDGVERIATQLNKSLEMEGVKVFGKRKDNFNPEIHECISVTKTAKKSEDNKISEILQNGYKLDNELIRPAKVIIFQFEKEKD